MLRTPPTCLRLSLSDLLPALTIVFLVLPISAGANPIPDAMVYFNVRPAGPIEESCLTEITRCREMTASTEQQGMLEFQVFIDPQQPYGGGVPVPLFEVDLSWPDAWILTDFRPCRGATDWYIDPYGPNPHRLAVQWPCTTVPDGLFLALTLVFDVQGYGILDTDGVCTLWLDCPATPVYPTANYAEAGTGCEYTNQPCAKWSHRCVPNLDGQELQLTAPEGGTAHGEVAFTIEGYPYPRCDFTAISAAPWAIGTVISNDNLWDAVLYVDADAVGLEPGVHECEMQLVYDGVYDGEPVQNARCLPVTLTVEPASSVEQPVSTPAAPGRFKLAGPNPSSGTFVFTYEMLAASHVRCGVYDASGREVATLVDQELSAGWHTVTWTAAGPAGRRVQPGVYMVRLADNGTVRTSRLVLLD